MVCLWQYINRNGRFSRVWFVGILVCCLHGISGCATTPYQYGKFRTPRERRNSTDEIAFEYGEPNRAFDRVRNVVELPRQVFLGSQTGQFRELSDANREAITRYLQQNDLYDVHVSVNQYDPRGEWHRLRDNRSVGAGWRYTAGLLHLAGYTILPGPAFGFERYNPYTNTLQINSNHLPATLHEAAFAKDVHSRSLPGTYAAVTSLPVISLWKTSHAMNDVLGYARMENNWELERDTYRECCPRMASAAVSPAGFFVTPLVGLGVTFGGHAMGLAIGHVMEVRRKQERDAETLEEKRASEIKLAGHSLVDE